MFVNLDTLPAGEHMYTIYVTNDEPGTPRDEVLAEEVDVTCDATRWGGNWSDPANYGKVHPSGEHFPTWVQEMYGDSVAIIGIVDQSDGYVSYDAFVSGDWRAEE